MGPYAYMTKMKLLLSMTYRYEFFISLGTQIILLFVSAFFWKAAYLGVNSVQNVNEQQMLTYSILSIVLGCLFVTSIEETIHRKVRRGDVAVDYIKPVNVLLMYFSEDVGAMVTALIQRVIPIIVMSCLFITVPKPASLLHFLLFAVSSCFSFLILWFVSALVGLTYFKVLEMGPVGLIKDYLIRILSGSFVPIWFFPKSVQVVLQYLPFIYTYQLPLSIYIGKSTIPDALKSMAIQIVWALVFFFLFLRYKRNVEKNIFVQGG